MSYDKIDAAFGNAKAAFGKLKIGVRMTKISEDKVHVVGKQKIYIILNGFLITIIKSDLFLRQSFLLRI